MDWGAGSRVGRTHAWHRGFFIQKIAQRTTLSANSRKGKKDFHHLSRLKTDASQEIIKKDLEPGTCLQILENIEASH